MVYAVQVCEVCHELRGGEEGYECACMRIAPRVPDDRDREIKRLRECVAYLASCHAATAEYEPFYLCCEHSGLAHGARGGPNSCGKPAVNPPCTERGCAERGTHATGIAMDPPHLTYRCCQHSAHVHGPGDAPWWHCPDSAEHSLAPGLRKIERGMSRQTQSTWQRFIRLFL